MKSNTPKNIALKIKHFEHTFVLFHFDSKLILIVMNIP